MSTQNILLIAVMAVIVIGVAFVVFKFVKSILNKRAYEREELPDIDAVEAEDVVLPDIEESGFSHLPDGDFDEDEGIYREISDSNERRSR